MAKKADEDYKRRQDLEEKFNRFWNKALKTTDVDYLKRLTTDDLVELKKAVSNINNLVTLRVTYSFLPLDAIIERPKAAKPKKTK